MIFSLVLKHTQKRNSGIPFSRLDLLYNNAEIILNGNLSATIPTVITGHSSGGLLAKAFGTKKNATIGAFETPKFENSKSYDALLGAQGLGRQQDIGWEKLINVYSDFSLFSAGEPSATANIRYPSSQSIIIPARTSETFCQIAAGCVDDDRFDHFCSTAVTAEKYKEYFTLWDRERKDINPIYIPKQ